MTIYNIFIHYYNEDIGKAVTNQINCEWISSLEEIDDSSCNCNYCDRSDISESDLNNNKKTIETVRISNENFSATEAVQDNENYILSAIDINNPKYDMIFIYSGLGYYDFNKQKNIYGATNSVDYEDKTRLYFDKMERISVTPWFFHSTYRSLSAAMTKAEELVNLFGKNHIMIGKEVPLDQYIDIV